MNGLCVLHNSTPDVMHVKSGDTDYNWWSWPFTTRN
jgi:hypothetical protein